MTTTHTRTSAWALVLVPMMALALLGAGCTTETGESQDVAAGEQSEFRGLDGSLTEFGFDEVATAYTDWLLTEPITEQPTAEDFELWISVEEELPVNDTFTNPIKLRSSEPRMFVLWTEGEDGVADTNDDYYKTYRY